ncbi:MAG: hypothetical protein EU547_06035 [Promethearchaeota archaeon]|nr:MAG: hypothetical protein EU547_06035 [Candidatus Lokiarchaeota archaeon]
MLNWNFYFNLVCSIGGMVFFIISLILIRKIKHLFPGGNIIKKWLVIQALIILFLAGYILNIIFLALEMTEFVQFFTALVYIFGALFVLLIVHLSYKTYKRIIMET